MYVAKHAKEKKGEWVSGNLMFFRMHRISDIYFVGGFGTVQWVDVADYMATKPDSIVAADPQETISVSHICTSQILYSHAKLVYVFQLMHMLAIAQMSKFVEQQQHLGLS